MVICKSNQLCTRICRWQSSWHTPRRPVSRVAGRVGGDCEGVILRGPRVAVNTGSHGTGRRPRPTLADSPTFLPAPSGNPYEPRAGSFLAPSGSKEYIPRTNALNR
jgi:hypothetical protein